MHSQASPSRPSRSSAACTSAATRQRICIRTGVLCSVQASNNTAKSI
jgi:hypothetical protein